MHLYTFEVEEEATVTPNVQCIVQCVCNMKACFFPLQLLSTSMPQGAKAPLIQHTGQHH